MTKEDPNLRMFHLAEEPTKDDNAAGTTYGEMALLLNAYGSMLSAFSIGKLRSK